MNCFLEIHGMHKHNLEQLYTAHMGKSIDKWSLYFREYDRLFACYRDKPINLLEIGIMNGGSLEIWAKYFTHALNLIGCDINPACGQLSYDETNIKVVIGDATDPIVSNHIFQHAPYFDIIIDDGSHQSSDVIKSFTRYFPHLMAGGLYIVEDLHCSYWSEFNGGLFNPYSSISFFKHLIDIINYEHWGDSKSRQDILKSIFEKYQCTINTDVLAEIHSIEFINSLCIIRKEPAIDNSLGPRLIGGVTESVTPAHKHLNGTCNIAPDQSKNPFTVGTPSSPEGITLKTKSLAEIQIQINNLKQTVIDRDHLVHELLTSTSWQITKPLRLLGKYLQKLKLKK